MLEDSVRSLAKGKNFAALTTLLPSGHPMTQVMWVDANDEHVLINTEVGRQKFANVRRDPRVTVTVIDAANPYHYVEVRGRVVDSVTGPVAREHIDALSQKYTGAPYAVPIQTERVILHIAPDRVRANG
ncbi:PPOX class F420-dependent oxidoreductase [Acidiferrimicrobium sp. IK]|uniref:PPOX class F420-dependent oxidoreductase n=1 Tax=Acidiferrimicrobium sp. IK TaxID=2871700 RepID=UPI0021CB3165|nr:PPOX class F420-dependent oxidoreductase [Acidiferrimicrobium sp. IK]MCU4184414.1 PPOX class F420-dependent oxidoreductase [Acidiferrimicrobium sp. IK]